MAYAFEGYIINEFRDTTVTVDGQTVDGLTLTEAAFNIPRYPFDSYGALNTPIKVFVCRISSSLSLRCRQFCTLTSRLDCLGGSSFSRAHTCLHRILLKQLVAPQGPSVAHLHFRLDPLTWREYCGSTGM
jgi:hypothetical protein